MYWNYVSDYKDITAYKKKTREPYHSPFYGFLVDENSDFFFCHCQTLSVTYKVQTKETKSSILICTIASEADDQSNQLKPRSTEINKSRCSVSPSPPPTPKNKQTEQNRTSRNRRRRSPYRSLQSHGKGRISVQRRARGEELGSRKQGRWRGERSILPLGVGGGRDEAAMEGRGKPGAAFAASFLQLT